MLEPVAMAVFTIFLVLLTTTIIWYRSKNLSNPRQLPLPPGPRGLPLVGSLPFLDPNLHLHFARLAAAYGPIFHLKLGQKLMVVVSSPSLAEEVLKEQDPILANRDVPANLRYMPNAAHGIGWTPNGDKWRSLRKLAVRELLHGANQRSYHELRRLKLRQTLKQVVAKVGSPIKIHDLVLHTSFEIMTHMLWGGEGFMAKGGSGVQEEFRKGLEEFNQLLLKPNLRDFFPLMGVFGLMSGVDRQARDVGVKFERLLDIIVTERAKTKSVDGEKLDFLSTLLKIKEEGDTKPTLTTADIKGILMDLVPAALDTTAITIEWAMTELLQNKEIMTKVREELDNVVGPGNLVEELNLSELHYLNAVLKEVLRLHPPAPLLIPRAASRACTVGGYRMPFGTGTQLVVNAWAIHRDATLWDDPYRFRPERFIGRTSDSWVHNGSDFTYFPFGSGRRMCPGIRVADILVKYLLASFLHSFDWELPSGCELDCSERFGLLLGKAVPLAVIPTRRIPNEQALVGLAK